MSDCIEWPGNRALNGYGRRWWQGKLHYAHRVAFELHHGRPPVGVVRHTCDNRPCVNPEHLLEGTHADNVRDMMERGRNRPPCLRGERHGMATLTAEQVEEIRARYRAGGITQAALGREYGISQAHVSKIVLRQNWAQ